MEQQQRPFLTQLQAAAAQAHEMYEAFIGSGFNDEQALRLVMSIVNARQEGNTNG